MLVAEEKHIYRVLLSTRASLHLCFWPKAHPLHPVEVRGPGLGWPGRRPKRSPVIDLFPVGEKWSYVGPHRSMVGVGSHSETHMLEICGCSQFLGRSTRSPREGRGLHESSKPSRKRDSCICQFEEHLPVNKIKCGPGKWWRAPTLDVGQGRGVLGPDQAPADCQQKQLHVGRAGGTPRVHRSEDMEGGGRLGWLPASFVSP